MKAKFHFGCKTEFARENTYFVEIPTNITTNNELFYFYAWAFNFPHWFGCNWNALQDMFIDLEGITEKRIIIYHENLPNLPNESIKIYIELMNYLVNHWNYWPAKKNEKRELIFAFSPKDEIHIKTIIDKINLEEQMSPYSPWPKDQHSY